MAIIPSTAKVLNQYENVNTTYGGSKAMKAQSRWYTMADVTETINASPSSSYKVFTALLTQTGSGDVQNLSSGAVTKGVTYQINGVGFNCTNVGAPNNENGTYFVATNNEVPTTYGAGSLTYNTGAPVVTILENTLEGTISFYYSALGNYVVVNSIPWDQTKTTFQLEQGFADFGTFVPSYVPITGSGKLFLTFDNIGTAGSAPPNILPPSDNVLNKSLIEIKVYN